MNKMTKRTRILRFVGGLAIAVMILGIAFPLLPFWFHTLSTNGSEVNHTYPGDELLTQSLIRWTHATTINAPPGDM
jgi:hypothetical protein